MKTKLFYAGFYLAATLTNLSCGVDEIVDELTAQSCNEVWTDQVKTEIDALNNAAAIFENDPTAANCENFRIAVINYVDSMEAIDACVLGTNRQAFDMALSEAKSDLNKNDCSDL